MAIKYDATLPATRCSQDMREAVRAWAEQRGVDSADIIREAVHGWLMGQGVDEEQEAAFDELVKVTEEMGLYNDRAAGSAWGPPAE